ncbi:putative RNA polymerase II mediator complex component Srb8 [Amniculicola lignicola CBS 123094]|uniref:Putative RNA polymerase II mediator complex component Srb8 n=1 Tax=Amniculicola lignicola CBS 123094 TaxID=1392246 RepID=A0A6A5VV07_9PLEO|nr:putative RNA polymerase II mediator complex component Srb8 [Amniculicola lignicola CBS 123094]
MPISFGSYLLWLATIAILFCASIAIRRIWFHPLSRFPGPKLWAATRVPYIISLLRGTLNQKMADFHAKYGDVVRLAPNELSFGCEEAWRDIYMYRPGHKETKKDARWYLAPRNAPQNIVTTTDIHVRARMRRLLAPSFNDQSLSKQSPVLEHYAELVLERLKSIVERRPKGQDSITINMLNWINFYTMDIIGDLALGESFHCLDSSTYHPWVTTLYTFFKGMIIASAARFFWITSLLIEHMVPKDIAEKQKYHTDFTNAKVAQRLEMKTERPDLITPFLRDMENSPEKMSLGEIQSTFAIILVAGSETTATTLLACLFELASNPDVQEKLYRIVKRKFSVESQITVSSTADMPYLDAVINEALRLCYPVPGGLPRLVVEDGDTYAGHFVPGGTAISIRPYVVFRSPKYFAKNLSFVPERWLPPSERPLEYANDRLSACQPFSVGPTNCIGKPLAWAEMRILLTKIIWNFKLAMSKEKPFTWEDQHMMMVVEKSDLYLQVSKRV